MFLSRLACPACLLFSILSPSVFAADSAERAYVMTQAQQQKLNNSKKDQFSNKEKQDYSKLHNSVLALSQALQRESRKANINNDHVLGEAKQWQEQAEKQAKSGHYLKALETLKPSYQQLTAAIVKLKDHSTAADTTPIDLNNSGVMLNAASPLDLEHDFATNAALLDALKRQNDEKQAAKQSEISEIAQLSEQARQAASAGHADEAKTLIDQANAKLKTTIASLQAPTGRQHDSREVRETNLPQIYDNKRRSMLALIDAAKRVADEKHKNSDFTHGAEHALTQAEQEFEYGNASVAIQKLDFAYNNLKKQMRVLLERPQSHKIAHKSTNKTHNTQKIHK